MIEHIRALAADIDMTLTAKGSDLPEITQKAFNILHRNGVLLGLATGREIEEKVRNMGKTWGLDYEFDFVIGMNGGQIYDLSKDHLESVPFMSQEEMKEVLAYMMPLIEKYKIAINAEGGGNHNAMNIGPELIASSARHGFIFTDKTGDIDGFCERPAFKMLFRTEARYEQEIRDTFLKKFGDRDQIIGTYPGTVEIMHKGIDKGSGMKKYADSIGLEMKDVIAFGDNENDNTLLQDCGWGVCLLNGSEGTKACADAITETDCESGGVGQYLFDHYINPKGLR
jgi:Cof subfamily protein (haloacid dehalogenase superfamily)